MNNILITDCLVVQMTAGTEQEQPFAGHIGISDGKIAFVAAAENVAGGETKGNMPGRAERHETAKTGGKVAGEALLEVAGNASFKAAGEGLPEVAGESVPEVAAFRALHSGDLQEIDGRGKLAMPGLVNTHNHISMTLLRGYADDLPLMAWLNDHIWPFEAKLTREDIVLGAQLGMAEMLLGGITTTADMYWMEEAVGEAAESMGIRTILGPTFVDARFEEFKEDFRRVAARYGDGRHPTVTFMVAPHSVYTCSSDHIRYAHHLCREHSVGMAIHVSETLDEQAMIRERYGKTPIEYLDSLGVLDHKSLIIHAVHVDERDMAIMADRGVSVAHNPQSNMKLSSGAAPVSRMLSAGINVSLGTDGASSNNDLDMWEEMRSASFLQKLVTGDPCSLPAHEMLRMATVNGAGALGLGGVTGELRAGLAADIILLDMERPHLYPRTDTLANLVYCAKSGDVDTVIVNGKICVRGGRLLTGDTAALCRAVQTRVGEISRR